MVTSATPEDSAAVAGQRADLAARLERLREQARRLGHRRSRPAPATVSETLVQVNGHRGPSCQRSDEEPIVVEEVRVLRDGNIMTIHDTVVRQGDKVLMVVRPDSWMEGRPDYIDEDDLFE
jgi:hypothetical protein